MGIINMVANIKEVHKEYVLLVKIGSFYYCYGRDAYIISYLLHLFLVFLQTSL